EGMGERYTAQDWEYYESQSLCHVPRWYRDLLVAAPLANIEYRVVDPTEYHPPGGMPTHEGCLILKASHLHMQADFDTWHRTKGIPYSEFREKWFPFAEGTSIAGVEFWVLPIDEAVPPVVHAFHPGSWAPEFNSGTWSTGLTFENFILSATQLKRGPKR
ncbi:MAG: hypothetical protein ACAH88_02035, partial [Roseimicrobium sp.]